jgi:hypothetical protein
VDAVLEPLYGEHKHDVGEFSNNIAKKIQEIKATAMQEICDE